MKYFKVFLHQNNKNKENLLYIIDKNQYHNRFPKSCSMECLRPLKY